MDEWKDVWMDRWVYINGGMDGWVFGSILYDKLDGCIGGWTDEDKLMDGWTIGKVDGGRDGCMMTR